MSQVTEILQTMEYGPAPEAAGQVQQWLAARSPFGHFIAGRFVASVDGADFEVISPSNGAALARVARAGAADVDAAVAAARRASRRWSALPGNARARYLYALARLLQKRERFFAVLETLDNGKPIRESRDLDVPLAIRHFYHHAGWAELVADEFPGYRPHGVCGQIIPWNFPLLMLAWKIAPALAAGNTVVLKPAQDTPLTALAFAELCREAGLPAGVVNIVNGDDRTGAGLVAHPDIDKLAFTGSTEVGRSIRVATAGSGKKLSLELGGKSPFIVFEEADLDSAIEGVVDAIWFNQGQVCCAGSRLLLHESIAERFHHKLKRRAEHLRVGDPLEKSTDIGAIVSAVQLQRIRTLVGQGIAEGGQCWQPDIPMPATGYFHPPTLFTGVAPSATIAREEIFGPVLVSMTFRTLDEAVVLANNTRYGLAASVWSENINTALDAAARIKAGVVWVNSTNLFDAAAGFGGYRESGFGREGGREGIYEYLAPPLSSDRSRRPSRRPAGELCVAPMATETVVAATPRLDRTVKLYIGGRQVRPDGGSSFTVHGRSGKSLGQAALGNRKDLRNAVEAAQAARGWPAATAHQRAQVLFYLAENLEQRREGLAQQLARAGDLSRARAAAELDASVARIMYYAAHADKFDGAVHPTGARQVTLAMPEPWGVLGIVCPDEAPLLAMVSLAIPAIAMGNRVVVVPPPAGSLVAADFCQVLETSDVPDGVVNIVTGDRRQLALTLGEHDDVAALWYFGPSEDVADVERACAGNLKATWSGAGYGPDWQGKQVEGREFLRHATQIKNIWIPYGE